ncbi:MAG: terminase [Alphaproteobacteria bacterium]|nr:terminase [Alphaproteobacteria bacterium]
MPNSTAGSVPSWRSTDRLRGMIFSQIVAAVKTVRAIRSRFYKPYPRQQAFHAAGALHRERLFMAGNQLGKTLAGAMEVSFHLTGRYPPWWAGRRFVAAVKFWAASDTAETTRDNVQRHLLGSPHHEETWGTGAIPRGAVVRTVKGRNAPGALSAIVVRHVTGAESVVAFKSYDQGRSKWQGESLDGVWFDEEPPLDIYSEGRTRTQATGGITLITFTPLLGMSEVVRLFLAEAGPSPDRR